MSDDVVYLPTGQPIGYRCLTADGGEALVGFDGLLLDAIDGNGVELGTLGARARFGSHAFHVAPAEARRIKFERRLALAEADAYIGDEAGLDDGYGEDEYGEADRDYSEDDGDGWDEGDDYDYELETRTFVHQLEREERKRGGVPFTRAETRAIGERIRAGLDAGEEVDVARAIQELRAEGDNPVADVGNLETREGRAIWAAERMQDGEREARGQRLQDPDPGSLDEYDADNREQRVLWQAEVLQGKDVGPLYASSLEGDQAGG
jgi:hypothetical protein